jgi:PKD repeat protein
MSTGRDEFSGLLLNDGRVVISGGFVSPGAVLLNTVEIYSPGLTPQINGLYNVVADLPNSAFNPGGRSKVNDFISQVNQKIESGSWAQALDKAQKLTEQINLKVADPAARDRLLDIVEVLIASLNDKISPNLSPTVAPAASPASGVEQLSVNFTANAADADGSIVYVLWNFGDFTTSNDLNPTHVYKCDGTYKATLEVADDRGAVASGTVTITVTSAGGPLTYDCDVQPVFNRVCTGCHGAARGLSLTTCEGLELGSSPYPNRKVVIPGDAASSILYQRITSTTAPMPPVGGLLPVTEQNAIRDWINSLTPGNYDYCQ